MTPDRTDFTPTRGTLIAAVIAIAAAYFYFLLFAGYALLELVRPVADAERQVRLAASALALGGIAGSVLAARRFRLLRYPRTLGTAYRACGMMAAVALWAPSFPVMLITTALTGLALGWLTVTLGSGLRATVGTTWLGWCAGLGTGIAYAACNLPPVFTATPRAQAIVAALLMIPGALTGPWLVPQEPSVAVTPDYRPRGVATWVMVLLALVWMDSAAFFVVQHTEGLRSATWAGAWRLGANAIVHLSAACFAGWWLARRSAVPLIAAAFALLAGACLLLDRGAMAGRAPGAEVSLLYAAGVSCYSVVLLHYTARGGRAWVVAMVFAVSGWIGTGLGVGMAQDLHRVPPAFVLAAGFVIAAALVLRGGGKKALLALAAGGLVLTAGPRVARADDAVALGREVYVAEGCIHCHSQYIRPGTGDVTEWGPTHPLSEYEAGNPPLYGNRRQGPDLTNVGNRRTPEWNRLHLIAPRTVSPGSRMPSYGYLFAKGDVRGEALVSYLASLGDETWTARAAEIAGWTPTMARPGETADGPALFARLCAGCHGGGGRADGPLAAKLSDPPPDFGRGAWRHPECADDVALLRLIKFGVAGTPMAGHEYLSDAELRGLAAYVRSLHASIPLAP